MRNSADVENETAVTLAVGGIRLCEHLLLMHKAAVIDPLNVRLQKIVASGFKRQRRAIVKDVLPKLKGGMIKEAISTKPQLLSALAAVRLADEDFGAGFDEIATEAYRLGAEHTKAALGGTVNIDDLDGPGRMGEDVGAEIDGTTADRLGKIIEAVANMGAGYRDVVQAVSGQFKEWQTAEPSRAELIAVTEVSTAYHEGAADYARTFGPTEKRWDVQPEACDNCESNAAEGWKPEAAPFNTGSFEPPDHPNCRCSLSYREAQP